MNSFPITFAIIVGCISSASIAAGCEVSKCYPLNGENYCLYSNASVLSWVEAREFCANRDSSLPIITDENIQRLFQHFIVSDLNGVTQTRSAWIGAYARPGDNSNYVEWHWIDGESSEDTGVLYDKLNVNSSSAADENPDSCVVVITGQWKVAHCTEQHLVVCQSDRLPRSIYDQSGRAVQVSSSNEVVLSANDQSATAFLLVSCLAWDTVPEAVRRHCYSLADANRADWYVRHYENFLRVEPEHDPANPSLFDVDSSFILHADTFHPGYYALESVNYPYHYIQSHVDGHLWIVQRNDTTDYDNRASFIITYYSTFVVDDRDTTTTTASPDNSTPLIIGIIAALVLLSLVIIALVIYIIILKRRNVAAAGMGKRGSSPGPVRYDGPPVASRRVPDQHQLPSAEMSNQSDPQADYEQLTNPDDNGYITVVGN